MAWTYLVAQLATSPMMQVRRLIGDVLTGDQQIQDEEINFALSQRPNIYGAAADCCRYIAAQYSRKSDTIVGAAGGNLKQNFSEQSRAYAARAADFENKAIIRAGAVPFAGGISIANKQAQEANPDRVPPQFVIGMDDNYSPVSPIDTSDPYSGTGN